MSEKTRVQLDLPPTAMMRLLAIKERTEAGSQTEVIKTALRLYAHLLTEQDAGKTFMVQNKDGTTTHLNLFL